MDFHVGDWVKSYSQGIWRVERIITDYYEFRYSLDEPKIKSNKTLFVVKRLVNKNWKRSFSMESCDSVFIHDLSEEEKVTLHSFIRANEKTMKDFEKYTKDVGCLLNISFSFSNEDGLDFDAITHDLFRDMKEMTCDDIIRKLQKSQLNKYLHKLPHNKTIQFVCCGEEMRNSEFIFRSYNILNF